jgi:hypothetical protein
MLVGLAATCSEATAQPASTDADSTRVQCAYQRKNHPDYVLWICDPEGTSHSRHGSVLWLRKNEAGADVLTRVWEGPSTELVDRAEDIISRHRRTTAHCQRYVHVALARQRAVTWNAAGAGMLPSLRSAFDPKRSGVCYTAEPGIADFVLVWSDRADGLPNAFTVQVPERVEPAGDARRGKTGTRQMPPEVHGTAVALGVYRVDPGMDNSILRLGLGVFPPAPTAPGASKTRGSTLAGALEFLATFAR